MGSFPLKMEWATMKEGRAARVPGYWEAGLPPRTPRRSLPARRESADTSVRRPGLSRPGFIWFIASKQSAGTHLSAMTQKSFQGGVSYLSEGEWACLSRAKPGSRKRLIRSFTDKAMSAPFFTT
jgi:hypothetical protein